MEAAAHAIIRRGLTARFRCVSAEFACWRRTSHAGIHLPGNQQKQQARGDPYDESQTHSSLYPDTIPLSAANQWADLTVPFSTAMQVEAISRPNPVRRDSDHDYCNDRRHQV